MKEAAAIRDGKVGRHNGLVARIDVRGEGRLAWPSPRRGARMARGRHRPARSARTAGHWARAALALVTLGLAGCAPGEPTDFEHSEKFSQLAQKHQDQIGQILREYFGSPSSPRLWLPAPASEDEGAASSGPAATSAREQAATASAPDGRRYLVRIPSQRLQLGERVYKARCANCHGVTGDGNGIAAPYLDPRPRDYRRGVFKFTSTPRGAKPRRSDLERIVRWGAKGTAMPSFRWLAEEELQAVVDYVRLLSERGELEGALILEAEVELGEEDAFDEAFAADTLHVIDQTWENARNEVVLPRTPPPPRGEETIELGRKAFLTRGCAKCHGYDGRGSPRDVGQDDWGRPSYAADITSGMLHGGHRPIDIYRRIADGINGTPMPAFGEALKNEPDTIWHMVYYVQELAAGRQFDNSDAAALEAQGQGAGGEAP